MTREGWWLESKEGEVIFGFGLGLDAGQAECCLTEHLKGKLEMDVEPMYKLRLLLLLRISASRRPGTRYKPARHRRRDLLRKRGRRRRTS